MKQLVTKAIVLSRTNFGEADRIISLLTPEQGKIRLLAKGVRKIKSKMAGGIELFSINDITFIQGRNEIGTLISSRLITNFGNIIKDIDRTMFAYEVLKTINKITEDSYESDYYDLLVSVLSGLDEGVEIGLVRCWFNIKLLYLSGHMPNLQTDTQGHKLKSDDRYIFNFDHMNFEPHSGGIFKPDHIKLLRLCENLKSHKISQVKVSQEIINGCIKLTDSLVRQQLKA
jgi:DNA repair protein RecO (recombination protein O)